MFTGIIGNSVLHWMSEGGDGVWTQVAESDLSSPATSVDFSGLNFALYDLFMWTIRHVEGSGVNCKVRLFVNNLLTATDYYATFLGTAGSGASSASINAPRIGETAASKDGLIWGVGALAGDRWYYESKFTFDEGVGVRNHSIHGTHDADLVNITQLTFEAQQANGFGTGSRVALYGLTR